MEDELGKQLLIRGNRKITLTEEGMILRKRAEEIVELVKKAENEIALSDNAISGEIYIGAGETDAVRFIGRIAKKLGEFYHGIHYHISSGDAVDISEELDKGLIDFAVLLDPVDISKYNSVKLLIKDIWGVLMRKDSPLSDKECIKPSDLWDKPLIVSRQAIKGSELTSWLKKDISDLNIVSTYNLVYNASLMVDEGVGYALCLDKIINTDGNCNLCFKPLEPKLEVGINIVWKKYQIFSKPCEKFLEQLQGLI
jgi:DNA-binding transcriptional LysR family regulator